MWKLFLVEIFGHFRIIFENQSQKHKDFDHNVQLSS